MIGLLTGKAALYVSGALLAVSIGLGFALWAQSVSLDSCKNDVTRLENEQTRLLAAVKDQNEAIARLKTIAIEKGRAADDALAKARESTAKYEASRKRLAQLLAVPAPAGAGCKEGVAAVRRELGK